MDFEQLQDLARGLFWQRVEPAAQSRFLKIDSRGLSLLPQPICWWRCGAHQPCGCRGIDQSCAGLAGRLECGSSGERARHWPR
jgi:hypothetical protein